MATCPSNVDGSAPSSRPRPSRWSSRPGKPIAEVARDLDIHDGTLGNWVNTWRRERPEPESGITPVERARVKEMEDEIRRLRMENEFLKKGVPRTREAALR
jgi:transposase-like protein